MTRTLALSSPLLLGFDDVERLLDRVSRSAEGYPPFNIERIAASGEAPARIVITLALAGFGADDIDVTLEDKELTVSGRQRDAESRDYLHRGIAARQFRRTFVLAEGLEVRSAELKDGLLSLELVRPEPARTVKRIEITSRGQEWRGS
jgi:HSP20 family molecular chaperone IbpA